MEDIFFWSTTDGYEYMQVPGGNVYRQPIGCYNCWEIVNN